MPPLVTHPQSLRRRALILAAALTAFTASASADPCGDAIARFREAIQARVDAQSHRADNPTNASRILTGAPALDDLKAQEDAASKALGSACPQGPSQ